MIDRRNLNNIWEVKIEFNEPDGAYDNAIFGEKTDELNILGNINLPKNPPGIIPYIRTWFNTDSDDPYNELWEEYKEQTDDYNSWQFSVQWVPSDYISPTTITISWDIKKLSNSEYNSVILYDAINSKNVANMLEDTSYTFTISALIIQNFEIICNKNPNQPQNNPKDSNSISEETDASNLNSVLKIYNIKRSLKI